MDYTNIFDSKYKELASRPQKFPRFKVELLDYYENSIGEITKDISYENAGGISVNYQQGLRRSVAVTLTDFQSKYLPYNNNLIWNSRKFKMYIGLKDIYTDDTYWFSQGVFYITNPSISRALSNKTITINGVDKFGIFTSDTNRNQLMETYSIPAGIKVYDAVKDILHFDMGNGEMADPVEPFLDVKYKNFVLPYNINKDPESYIGDILIEIANVLGCDIFYDVNGRLNISDGTEDLTYSQQSSVHSFLDSDGTLLTPTQEQDFVNAVNIIKVVGDNTSGTIYEYTAKNTNALSSTCIDRIGYKSKRISSSAIPNLERAKDYAEYKLNQLSRIANTTSFASPIIPHLDVNRVVELTDDYLQYVRSRHITQSLTMPFIANSLVNITTCNLASLPYWEGSV